MDKSDNKSPTVWTRPAEVMKMHRLKQKKRALQFRMTDNGSAAKGNVEELLNETSSSAEPENVEENATSNFNPFRHDRSKRFKPTTRNSPSLCDLDASSDNTLFQLLHQSNPQTTNQEALNDSFANFLDRITGSQAVALESTKKKESSLPLDWSLKFKVRIFSKKALPWSQNLKMLDEASGTTAFSRCINLKDSSTSPSLSINVNAQLHQTCLVWQHPVLPWLPLFPRSNIDKNQKKGTHSLDPEVKESLHNAWRESFRSLIQLVRAHQCPYFYLCANKFTCMIRAAGIGGFQQIHAVLSPTTAGFRRLLQKDEIAFTLPLHKESSSGASSVNTSPTDQGYDTQESKDCNGSNDEDDVEKEDEVDDEADEEWLQSMGVGVAEIKKLNSAQSKVKAAKATKIDQKPSSTVLVHSDEHVMALFNLLLNCRSISTTIGHLAGIPPTLLSPVAFHGATLKSLSVGHKTVNQKGEKFFCTEVIGPVLPHTLRDLCAQLEPTQGQFSMTCSVVEHSKVFSVLPTPEVPITSAFTQENLRDCGLTPGTLKAMCKSGPATLLTGVKYENSQFTCQE